MSRVNGSARCVNVEGAGRRERLVFDVDVLVRNPKPWTLHMLCRHASVSFLGEHPLRDAVQGALRSASPLSRKPHGLGNDKGAIARMVLEALALQIWRSQSTRPSMTPQAVVVKQAELRQAEERANSKSKELRELHAEMLKVEKEATQVVPPPAPLRPLLRGRPLYLCMRRMVVKMVTSPPWPEMMMRS